MLSVELNNEKAIIVHNAKEDKDKVVIGLTVESNKFIKTKNIENVLFCHNITNNRKLRKGRKKLM